MSGGGKKAGSARRSQRCIVPPPTSYYCSSDSCQATITCRLPAGAILQFAFARQGYSVTSRERRKWPTHQDKPSGVRGVSWRDQETSDLIALWGDKKIQAALAVIFHSQKDLFFRLNCLNRSPTAKLTRVVPVLPNQPASSFPQTHHRAMVGRPATLSWLPPAIALN